MAVTLPELAASFNRFANAIMNQIGFKANLDSPELTGQPLTPTPDGSSPDLQIANKKYTQDTLQNGLLTMDLAAVQSDVDDLTPGKAARIESIRRRLVGDINSTYLDRLILLNPAFDGAQLPYSIVDGYITATRGGLGSSGVHQTAYVSDFTAYNNGIHVVNGPNSLWELVTCRYQGTLYVAVIIPYHQSGYGSGIYFEGRAVSHDPNQLKIIAYYDRINSTILDNEVYNSITPLPQHSNFFLRGRLALTTGNTTVDTNGFVKAASPIVKLFSDHIEANEWVEGVVFNRLGVGKYEISGTSGLRSGDGWYLETPLDRNKVPYFNVEWSQDTELPVESGVVPEGVYTRIVIECYERVWDAQQGLHVNGVPADIPTGRWIDLRLNSRPEPVIDPELPQ